MKQDVTHWPVTGSDGYSGFTFGPPIELKGRWEEKGEMFLTEENEEVVSKAVVYLGADVDVGDYLAEGKHALIPVPTALSNPRAYRVRQRAKITDLRNLQCLRKAYL